LIAAAVCLILTVRIWQVLGRQQAVWPIPALYLIEMLVLTTTVAVATFRRDPASGILTWIALGAISAFCFLAGFSIGFLYVSVAVLLLATGLLFIRRASRSPLIFLGSAIVAAMVQVGIVLTAIRILSPGSLF
jgi:hypothetical protein